jgi:hypothetical protein
VSYQSANSFFGPSFTRKEEENALQVQCKE